jgi:hypothetical protein
MQPMQLMKRVWPILVIALLAILWMIKGGDPTSSSDTIDYQGQSIKLKKAYGDYEDYKSDPDPIAAEEIARVQQLVKFAPVAAHFADHESVVRAMFDIKFPGYSVGSYATTLQADGSTLELWGVEVPKADSMRFLLFRGRSGVYELADDFVQADGPRIEKVTGSGKTFVYATQQGAKVLERTPRAE